jgi:DNA-binding transcriptional ArsR family regulator
MTRGQTASDHDLEQLTSVFRLLADRTRLAILVQLSRGEHNVTTLCELLRLPQPTVSHHLGLLRMNNMVGNRRNGKQVFYSLNGSVEVDQQGSIRVDLENYALRIGQRQRSLAAAT